MCIFPLCVLHNELASVLKADEVIPSSLGTMAGVGLLIFTDSEQWFWPLFCFGTWWRFRQENAVFKDDWPVSLLVECPGMRNGKIIHRLKYQICEPEPDVVKAMKLCTFCNNNFEAVLFSMATVSQILHLCHKTAPCSAWNNTAF